MTSIQTYAKKPLQDGVSTTLCESDPSSGSSATGKPRSPAVIIVHLELKAAMARRSNSTWDSGEQ